LRGQISGNGKIPLFQSLCHDVTTALKQSHSLTA
jgi:hypothetical protein